MPVTLRGKPAPPHMVAAFPELVNPKTGCFKTELGRSFRTKDRKQGEPRWARETERVIGLLARAERAMLLGANAGAASPLTGADIREIAEEAYRDVLAADDAEREEGDDRRHLQTPEERQRRFPDLISVEFGRKGMLEDHQGLYAGRPEAEPSRTIGYVDIRTGRPTAKEAVRLVWPAADASKANGNAEARKGEGAQRQGTGPLIETLRREFRQALARGDTTIVAPETRAALAKRGVVLDPSSDEFYRAGKAVLEAHVRAYDDLMKRAAGDPIVTPLQPAEVLGPKLSEAFEEWRRGGATGTKRPAASSIKEAEHGVRRFIELHGDLRLPEIDKRKARSFRDAMVKIRTRLPRKLRMLHIRDLLSRDLSAYPPRSPKTIDKLVGLVSAVMQRASEDGHLDHLPNWSNPFSGLRLAQDHVKDARGPFTKAELRALFGSPVYTEGARPKGGKGDASFWFPLVGLFSGLRLGEITGLRICDLRFEEEEEEDTPGVGIWVFAAAEREDHSLKTKSSSRIVPVHPELERIGLLRYREALIARGAKPEDDLWPGVKSGPGRRKSAAWSQWFGGYLRGPGGVPNETKTFHSLRHNFKRMIRDAGVSEEMHDALTGHSGGGVGRSYGRDQTGSFSLRPPAEAIERIDPPIDLSGINWD